MQNRTFLRPRPWKAAKEKAGEVRSDYGNLWNARSARGGDPERLLRKDKPFFLLLLYTLHPNYAIFNCHYLHLK